MPSKAKRFCLRHACPNLVESGYCDIHRPVTDTLTQKEKNAIYDRRWSKVRALFMRDHPLCSDCESEGRITAAEEVHHLLKARAYPHLRLDPNNLLSLCSTCHRRRTAQGE